MSEDTKTTEEPQVISTLNELEAKLEPIRSDYINVVMRNLEETFNPPLPLGVENNIKTGAVLIIYTQVTDGISDQNVGLLQLGTTMPKDMCMHVVSVALEKISGNS